jgi:phosphopantothenoylcysteine synthetase/decarboxylase
VVDDESSSLFQQPDHTWLATHAQGILVYPSTSDFIAKLAAGRAMDVASATFLAGHERPRMIVPSMNLLMWSNPIVQRNVEFIKVVATKTVAPEVRTIVELFMTLWRPPEAELHRGSSCLVSVTRSLTFWKS